MTLVTPDQLRGEVLRVGRAAAIAEREHRSTLPQRRRKRAGGLHDLRRARGHALVRGRGLLQHLNHVRRAGIFSHYCLRAPR